MGMELNIPPSTTATLKIYGCDEPPFPPKRNTSPLLPHIPEMKDCLVSEEHEVSVLHLYVAQNASSALAHLVRTMKLTPNRSSYFYSSYCSI